MLVRFAKGRGLGYDRAPMNHPYSTIFWSTLLLGFLREIWSAYKRRKMREPTPMKLKNGVYVPWGIEQRSAYWWRRFGELSIAYFLLLGTAIVARSMGWWGGF